MILADYLSLPWTIVPSRGSDDGEYITLRIPELPGFLVSARSDAEAEAMFWPALTAFIESYLEDGETPPVPTVLEDGGQAALYLPMATVEVRRYELGYDLAAALSAGTRTPTARLTTASH